METPIMKTLIMKTPVRQLRSDLVARLKAVRWGVVISRASVVCGTVATMGAYAHLLPARYAGPFTTLCLIAAGLSPRLQKAAGIFQSVQDGQTPLVEGVKQAWAVFVTARQEQALVRKAEALAPVMAKAEQLRTTLQGDGPSAAEIAAGHAAIGPAPAPDGLTAAGAALEKDAATAVSDAIGLAAISATGGNQ